MKKRHKIAWVAASGVLILVLVLAFRPTPIVVETATVSVGPLLETLDEEGKTRMHDRFVLTATIVGKLRRIELHAGDRVRTGEVVAWIDPAPIEPRETAVLRARLEFAKALQREADALVRRAQAEHDQAASDLNRSRTLFDQGITSKESLEKVSSVSAGASEQLEAAKSRAQAAAHQVEEATAALMSQPDREQSVPVAVQSPVDGRVLRLVEQSERVLMPGAPIIEIGHEPKLEIVADFLTADAVKIRPGMDAIIDDWGGDKPLLARVRVVEPGAFTKISALGVEEQRVNVVLDFIQRAANLADAYRVEVRVATWQSPNVLKVASSAVFRTGDDWSVFAVDHNLARKTHVKLGHRGEFETQIMEGLRAGDSVIVHAGADVKDGVRVKATQRTRS
jgi:HlyD family secretion protein